MAKNKNYTRGENLARAIQTLRDDKGPGKVTRGIFLEIRPLVSRKTGEIIQGNFDQDLYVMDMEDLDTGKKFSCWADAGFRGTMEMSGVAQGAAIEVEHTGRKEITREDGKPANVQTYAIYELQAE